MAKKKSAAQKQRAKARQQLHQQRMASADPQAAAAPQPRAARAGAKGAARRRPTARSRRSSSRRTSWAAIGAVVAVVAIMFVVFATRKSSPGGGTGGASAKAIEQVTSVPASTLEKIGVPSSGWAPARLPTGTPAVQADGKPMVMYIGAEYCPYCAAERWPMVVALSRFGTFSDLEATSSGPPPEAFPNTATLTFYGSSYTSDHLTFSSAETETRTGGHLQDMTSQQQDLFNAYNTQQVTGSNGAIPFVMIGNLYTWAGTSVDPGVLKGKSFDQIAGALSNPNSDIAKAIDGSANDITAMICQLTGNQPTDVCSAPYIQQAQSALPAS